jgi:ferredoxin-NADP reductase
MPTQIAEFDVVVARKREIADDAVSLTLRSTGPPLPEWAPGAHIDVVLPSKKERQYSLCGNPANRDEWLLGVLREEAGRGGSAFVCDELAEGTVLKARGPRNNFPLVPATRYLFIAGGIGVTPILPMLRVATDAGTPWQLWYGGRRRTSQAFTDELAGYGDRVHLWPQDERGLLPVDELLATPTVGTLVYCCGPAPLLAAVEQRCAGWPAGTLHLERFAPVAAAPGVADEPFEVELARSRKTVVVPAGTSILHAVEAAGVVVLSSCQEGTCGTCETEVVEGVPDHRDCVLTEEERAAGEVMMICVSRSRSPRLVLDL